MDPSKKTSTWKDYAGIAVCSVTVLSFIAVGFIIMFTKFLGVELSPPGDWMAAMLSLASTALGWLAGQKGSVETQPQPLPRPEPAPNSDICPTCPFADKPMRE
jgi:hypothetical protein